MDGEAKKGLRAKKPLLSCSFNSSGLRYSQSGSHSTRFLVLPQHLGQIPLNRSQGLAAALELQIAHSFFFIHHPHPDFDFYSEINKSCA